MDISASQTSSFLDKNPNIAAEVIQKAFLFFEAQRSGDLDEERNRIPWRGDSALTDGADVGRDLTGGYYDSASFIKVGYTSAFSMTTLSWTAIEYEDDLLKIGQLDEMLGAINHGIEYILKAYDDKGTATVADDALYGQVGNPSISNKFWGPPELIQGERPAYKIDAQNPGSDLAGESAAALASASILYEAIDPARAKLLREKAKKLITFAEAYLGKFSDAITTTTYKSSGFKDDLIWANIWMHKAEKAAGNPNSQYLAQAEKHYQELIDANLSATNNEELTHNWQNKLPGATLLLAQETGKANYKAASEAWLDSMITAKEDGGIAEYTEDGFAVLHPWGSTRHAANVAMLAGIHANTIGDKDGKYAQFAKNQATYLVGNNSNDYSYVIGVGDNYPQNPHHRGAHGSLTNDITSGETKNILYGGMVGGPKSRDDIPHQDLRGDYQGNEPAMDFTAALTGAFAYLLDQNGGTPLPDSEIPKLFDPNTSAPTPTPAPTVPEKLYRSGEIFTQDLYQYGKMEVRMRAAEADGVISNFFMYKPDSDQPEIPWEGVSFNVLGKDGANAWQSKIVSDVGDPTISEIVHQQPGLADDYHEHVRRLVQIHPIRRRLIC